MMTTDFPCALSPVITRRMISRNEDMEFSPINRHSKDQGRGGPVTDRHAHRI
jgi:hypothetical protein